MTTDAPRHPTFYLHRLVFQVTDPHFLEAHKQLTFPAAFILLYMAVFPLGCVM